jgi:hypothetical protein
VIVGFQEIILSAVIVGMIISEMVGGNVICRSREIEI